MTDFLNVLVVGLLLGGIYSLVSIGLNLIFGVIRIVNFAQGEFVMLGMYGTFAAVTMLHMDPYLSLVLTLPALFLLGVVVQRFLLQPLQNEPMMQIFATFGLLILLQNIVLAMTRGAALSINAPISSLTVPSGRSRSASCGCTLAAAALVALGLGWFLHNTLQGRAIRAVAQDRRAARLMGIDVERTFMLTFGIGAALAGPCRHAADADLHAFAADRRQASSLAAFAVVVSAGSAASRAPSSAASLSASPRRSPASTSIRR